jgi:hypothetical protein
MTNIFVAFPLSIPLFKQNSGEQVMKESNPLTDWQYWLATNWTDFKGLCKQNQLGPNDVLRKISEQMKICKWNDD